MKIVIIEDEPLTAEDLAETIPMVEPSADIVAILHSVKEAIAYLRNNEKPDLIFSDIHLGDGLSFTIFEEAGIATPVIFCTAYDEYAIESFQSEWNRLPAETIYAENHSRSFSKIQGTEK
jgi:DNA-binding LytR/AlgR family response regulator